MSDSDESLIRNASPTRFDGETEMETPHNGWTDHFPQPEAATAHFGPPMLFGSIQQFPSRLSSRMPMSLKYVLGVAAFLLWVLCMYLLSMNSLFAYPEIDGDNLVHSISCDVDLSFWAGPNAACGLEAQNCLGSKLGTIYKFRCPANCVRESWTYTPMAAGRKVAYHEPFVVGSRNAYRSDSSICAAALHHGIISDKYGGCGVLQVQESPDEFVGELGNNTITSFPFEGQFVSSFTFLPVDHCEGCTSHSSAIMWVNFFFTVLFAYFVTDSLWFFLSISTIGFWTVILAANPPWHGGSPDANAKIISRGLGRYMPCFFGLMFIYRIATEYQLTGSKANLSRAVLWAVPFYLGILENYTFGYIPVDRLMISDLNGQAGAWTAFIIIAVIVSAIVARQAYVIWARGYFVPYICLYLAMAAGLVILGLIPHVTLRIHHYILALLFIPGTFPRTGLSYVYQGLLVGLFVAGGSRWGFDPIVQTYEQLRRGGPIEHGGYAYFLDPLVSSGSDLKSFVLNWAQNSTEPLLDGYSLVINDVERWRGPETAFNLTQWAWGTLDLDAGNFIYYVRIAAAALSTNLTGGYTLAGVADLEFGTWISPEPGQT